MTAVQCPITAAAILLGTLATRFAPFVLLPKNRPVPRLVEYLGGTLPYAAMGLLVALAMVLSWVEQLVPLSVQVPGVKLGLANLAVLFALYRLGVRAAWTVSLLRVALVSLTFGNAYSLWYSLAGAVLSLLVMGLLRKTGKFSLLGVSVAGAVSHNLGQIAVAAAVLGAASMAYYLPVLLVSGTAAGVCVGAVAAILVRRIQIQR